MLFKSSVIAPVDHSIEGLPDAPVMVISIAPSSLRLEQLAGVILLKILIYG